MSDPSPTEIERYRQRHIGRLIHTLQRHFNEESLHRLHALGHTRLTISNIVTLPHIDPHGTRQTELARRTAVSKQAIGQLVTELETHGYVHRTADPSDGRATLIQFTELGQTFLRDAFRVKQDIEQGYRAILGDGAFAALEQSLITLNAHLDTQPDKPPKP